ncbi:MAG: sulfate ABC transporter permease subunit CysW [Candidatus Hydrogenedentes bacterium]|nr:sulfate ABC transporter permease subunit CysW [Candidatus Hydrogenedentota bacterium]
MSNSRKKKFLILAFRFILSLLACSFLVIFIFTPLLAVFSNAFQKGVSFYLEMLKREETISALTLTLGILIIVLPLNVIFGVACAWYVTKYQFRGKRFLVALLDLPFTLSPVVAGTMLVLLYSVNGVLGWVVESLGMKIIFAFPGLVIATLFVTFPFIARELIPVMEEQGSEMEEAGRMLGASGRHIFFRITLPNIKWGLFYGVVLCVARCVGEFGAVSVVSGHIRGKTITLPLEIEILYNEYNLVGAFCLATVLCGTGLLSLILRKWIESSEKVSKRRYFFGD